jgi:hypothetical protein
MLTSKPFKMNTYKNHPQVFILIDLHKTLSPLESALTKKGGRGKAIVESDTVASIANGKDLLV